MFSIQRSAMVSHSASKMYELVADVASYPKFLPGCKKAEVLRQQTNFQEARLQFENALWQQEWETRNTLKKPHSIEMQLTKGPFRSLQGMWEFKSLADDECQILLTLEIEPQENVLKWVMKMATTKLADQLVKAFQKRANVIYGGSEKSRVDAIEERI